MFYVSWIREYPIYEPAEGGYYYAGEQVFYCAAYPTWKKANRAYRKLQKEFADYCGYCMDKEFAHPDTYYFHRDDNFYHVECGGVGKYCHPLTMMSSRFVGQSEWVQITRRKPQGCGWRPYC